MNNLQKSISLWQQAGFISKVVNAPSEAFSFDKMLIVYSDFDKGIIRRVSFYNSKSDKITQEY